MKILVISDSHGNIANIKHVMGFAKNIKVSAVIHCGDWDNEESVEAVLSFGIPLYSILGNADVDSKLEDMLKFECKKFEENLLQFELDSRKISVIHQVKLDDERLKNQDVVFSGHYHSKEIKEINFVKFVRPGALINGNDFAVYETTNNEIEFFTDVEI
ncbi:MAG TPA: YfcE family phosphodiesterase [Patescibacteria group bacterium]|nr:YfcE family phosphodiesterase [Patescibacteria group bacterium]